MTNPTEPTAGWYPDPTATASGTLRWWNGSNWSNEVRAAKPQVPAPVAQPAPPAPATPSLTPPPGAGTGVPASSTAAGASAIPPFAVPPAIPPYAPQYPQVGQYPQAGPGGYTGGYTGHTGYTGQSLVGPGEPKSFTGAISSVLKQYVGFGGRASRSEFWYFTLFTTLVAVAVWVIMAMLLVGVSASSTGTSSGSFAGFGVVVGLLYTAWILAALAVVLPTLAVSVRRLRDAGQHWAWLFISFVPFGSIVLIVLWCQPSKPWALPRS